MLDMFLNGSAVIARSGHLIVAAWWCLLLTCVRRDRLIRLYAGLVAVGHPDAQRRTDARAVLTYTPNTTPATPPKTLLAVSRSRKPGDTSEPVSGAR